MARDGRGLFLARLGVTEVETVKPLGAILVTCGDGVELVLHGGREVVVDELAKVVFHQADDGEGDPGRHERVAAREHVAAVLDGLDDRRIRRRAADAQVFHLLHQAGLGVARRRIGGVAVRGDFLGTELVALVQVREASLRLLAALALAILGLGGGIGKRFVRLEEAREGDGAAGGGELDLFASGR